jgi:hypothetical protein
MNVGQTEQGVKFYYPTCSFCSTSECRRFHRYYTYEGYLDYLFRDTEPAAPGEELDKMARLTDLANSEFGPGYTTGKCLVCISEHCMRPHRTLTKEGYALFLRRVMKVASDEEAVRITDETFDNGDTQGNGGGWYDDGFTGEGAEED